MIEELILNYLSAALDIPCHMELPENPSGSFCVVEKAGSDGTDEIPEAVLAVQSYGGTKYEAARLNHRVVQAMAGAGALPQVVSCQCNTDYDFPDTTHKLPRYQAVFQVVYYD